MVILSRSAVAAVAALCLSFSAWSAQADDNGASGILGQIENQVSGIAAKNSRGVVTIEDLRSIEMEDIWKAAFSIRKRGIRHQLIDALSRRADADLQIAVLGKTGKSGSPAMAAAAKARSGVITEIETLRADLGKTPDAARLNVDVDQGYLDALNARKAKVDAEYAQFVTVHRAGSSALTPILTARTVLATQCQEAQAVLTADRQKLQTQSAHFDPPRVGTGFSIGEGYILTTADVLDGMSEPVVITDSGERMRTHVLGIDNETNIGLLRINGQLDIPALLLGESALVAPGHFAICIGNQAGSVNSVALSTISGVRSDGIFSGRRFYPSLLQVSGPVVPGNSGAPILNSNGQVVGMVVAVPVTDWTPSAMSAFTFRGGAPQTTPAAGGATDRANTRLVAETGAGTQQRGPAVPGIPFFRSAAVVAGYAMPIDAARPIIGDFKAGKPAQHCWIGISVNTQFSHSTLPDRLDLVRTVKVNGLYPDSPAIKAGIQLGDQIVSINGRPTREEVDVRIASMMARPGDPIMIEVLRGAQLNKVTLSTHAEVRPARFPKPIQAQDKR